MHFIAYLNRILARISKINLLEQIKWNIDN